MRFSFPLFFLVILLTLTVQPLYADVVSDATAMIEHRQFESAITLLKDKIQNDPSFADLYYLLGKAYYLKGDYELAEKELQNCLDRKRNFDDAQAILAMVLINEEKWDKAKEIIDEGVAKSKNRKGMFLDALGLYHLAKKAFTEADLAFRRALIEDPNSNLYKRHLADLNYENKVYGVAVDLYKEVLAVDSTDVITHFRLANALFVQKMFTEALKFLSTAIRLDSSYTEAYQLTGSIYMILGLNAGSNGNGSGSGNVSEGGSETSSKADDLFKNAIWMYNRYLKLGGKETSDVDYRLGQAYYWVKGYPTAVEYLDKVIATGTAKSNAYNLKAKALFRLKRYDDARAAYRDYETKITAGDSNYHWTAEDYDFFNERAQTYYQLYWDTKNDGAADSSFLELAIPDFQKAIELKEKNIDSQLYGKLGYSFYTLKRFQEAIPWYEKKIATDSNDFRSYQNLAYCYVGLKNSVAAVDLLVKVTTLNPNQCGPYKTLSSICMQDLKDRKQAANWYLKWAQCDSIDHVPYRMLGYLALTEKPVRKEAAIDYLQKASRRMDGAGIDPCKDIDVITLLAQAFNMYEDDAHKQESLKWVKKGLKCDPGSETLKNLKESLEE